MFVTTQILDAEPSPDFDICILTLDPSIIDENLVDSRIRVCLLDEQVFDGLSVDVRIPLAAYLVLAIPKAFHGDYQRIVYLDTDVFLENASISELFDEAPVGRAVSAVADVMLWLGPTGKRFNRYLNITGVYPNKYLNSGVVVFDVEACEKENLYERFMDAARQIPAWQEKHPETGFAHDQTAMNVALKGDWHSLSFRWNWATVRFSTHLIKDYQPKIIHFVGRSKPWAIGARPYTKKYLMGYLEIYNDYFVNQLKIPAPRLALAPWSSADTPKPEAIKASYDLFPKIRRRPSLFYLLARLRLLPKFVILNRIRMVDNTFQKGNGV